MNLYIGFSILSTSSLSHYKMQMNMENLVLLILVHIANDNDIINSSPKTIK